MSEKRYPHVEVYQDEADEWRWRLVGANGEKMAQGESHPTEWAACAAVRNVEEAFVMAPEYKVVPRMRQGS